jgi:hypothetical protein
MYMFANFFGVKEQPLERSLVGVQNDCRGSNWPFTEELPPPLLHLTITLPIYVENITLACPNNIPAFADTAAPESCRIGYLPFWGPFVTLMTVFVYILDFLKTLCLYFI